MSQSVASLVVLALVSLPGLGACTAATEEEIATEDGALEARQTAKSIHVSKSRKTASIEVPVGGQACPIGIVASVRNVGPGRVKFGAPLTAYDVEIPKANAGCYPDDALPPAPTGGMSDVEIGPGEQTRGTLLAGWAQGMRRDYVWGGDATSGSTEVALHPVIRVPVTLIEGESADVEVVSTETETCAATKGSLLCDAASRTLGAPHTPRLDASLCKTEVRRGCGGASPFGRGE